MKATLCHGQPSWRFASDRVEAAVTRLGGHLGPVRFRLGPRRVVAPFSVAPWAEEVPAGTPPLLRALRGDFFCAPFGGGGTPWRGEDHPPHGETANARWTFRSLERSAAGTELRLSLRTRVRPGRVEKRIALRRGETALYCRHVVAGMAGPMPLGHHAMLHFASPGRVSTSPIRFAQVCQGRFEDPAQGGSSALRPGAVFSRLDRVPAADGTRADLSRYPAREGNDDLVLIVHEARPDFAWTAVTFPEEGYVWFALKDPRVLRSTVMWLSNGGRPYPPWNGRHRRVLGLEDVTAAFHHGLAASARANPVRRRGFPTALRLRADRPLTVSYIMAVAAVPRGFDRVRAIRPERGGVRLVAASGRAVAVPLHTAFLATPL